MPTAVSHLARLTPRVYAAIRRSDRYPRASLANSGAGFETLDPVLEEPAGHPATPVTQWLIHRDGGTLFASTDQLLAFVDAASFSEAERLGIAAYAEFYQVSEPAAKPRVTELHRILSTPDTFLAKIRAAIPGVRARLTVVSFLANVSGDVTGCVEALVVDEIRSRPGTALRKLRSNTFEHPADREFLRTLQAIPGIGTIAAKFLDFTKKSTEIQLLASSIHVTASSIPWLYGAFRDACDALDITTPPPLYLMPGEMNAFTTGVDKPFVVVTSAAANWLDRQEMMFVLGHELGHILAGHVKYHTLGRWMQSVATGASAITLGLSKLLADITFAPALYAWIRRSEFTADRAGLLACQDREAALRAMLKLSGFPPRGFDTINTRSIIEQAHQYQNTLGTSTADRMFDTADILFRDHPRTTMRAAELLNWVDDGNYDEILSATPSERAAMAAAVDNDVQRHQLGMDISRILTAWCVQELSVPKHVAAPVVRQILYQKESVPSQPFDQLLRIELHIAKSAAAATKEIRIYRVVKGDVVRIILPLNSACKWEELPQDMRSEFLGHGERELTRTLFSADKGAGND